MPLKLQGLTRSRATQFRLITAAAIASLAVAVAVLGVTAATPQAQGGGAEAERRKAFDQILDLNVRDGFVYYRALKAGRGQLDAYVASLASASIESAPAEQQIAFWLNAYNAIVLKTVVDHYPITQRSKEYPARSIRQIPGAFDKLTLRAAGRTVTLDQIEKRILPEFKEPRLFLALGRGAVGSGRLRSEAYTAARLEKPLADIQAEFVTNRHLYLFDRLTNQLSITPILSWREADFAAAYDKADPIFAQRSAIERAIIAFITPYLLPMEKEQITQNQFKVVFHEMDWRLNDLTGGSRVQ